jgi:hypothetical protein
MAASLKPAAAPFWRSFRLEILAVVLLFGMGLGVRLLNVTDPPLDAAVRQLRSAIIARGMYDQMLPNLDPQVRENAIALWKGSEVLEPQIFERLVSLVYWVAGGEFLWIPRLFASLFWLIGGIFLYDLAKRMTSAPAAGVALAFYMIQPLGVYVSRRFQPDALMVMFVLISGWALYRWDEHKKWRWAVLTGMLCGLAILIKVTAVFFVAGMAVAIALHGTGVRKMFRSAQVWTMAAILTIVPALYYLFGIQSRSEGYFLFWNVSYVHLLREPWFYIRWWEHLNALVGLSNILIGLAGALIAPTKGRSMLLGLWGGYALYGLAFPFQIHTHDYYNLILVAIVALALAPVAERYFDGLRGQKIIWKALLIGVMSIGLFLTAWQIRMQLAVSENRTNWAAWQRIGRELPKDEKMVGLTHDYGLLVQYFAGISIVNWPTANDFGAARLRGGNTDFETLFANYTAGCSYFLVTLPGELEMQSELKTRLYDHYEIYADGDGYTIFDLRKEK